MRSPSKRLSGLTTRSTVRRFAAGIGVLFGLAAALVGRPWLGATGAVGLPAAFYGLTAPPHRLLYLAVFLMPLDLYRIDLPVPISLYRLTLVALAVSVGVRLSFGRRAVRGGAIPGMIVLFLASTLMAFGRADDFTQAASVLLNILAGLTLVLICYHVLDTRERLRRAVYWLLVSHVFTLVFATFTWAQYALFGVVIGELPLGGLLPLPLADPGHLATETAVAGFPRLALPYASPPALSLALAVTLLLGLSFRIFGKRGRDGGNRSRVPLFWLPLLLVLLLGTISRSGWVAFLAGLAWFFVCQGKLRLRYMGYAVAGACLVVAVAGLVFPTEAIASRLEITEGTREHLQTRLEALKIFSRDFETSVLGVGLNSYQEYSVSGGPHSHSPLTTVLAERGILGWLTYWPMYLYLWLATYWSARDESDADWQAEKAGLSAAVAAILVGSVLYEFILINHVWLAIALAAGGVAVDRRRSSAVIHPN